MTTNCAKAIVAALLASHVAFAGDTLPRTVILDFAVRGQNVPVSGRSVSDQLRAGFSAESGVEVLSRDSVLTEVPESVMTGSSSLNEAEILRACNRLNAKILVGGAVAREKDGRLFLLCSVVGVDTHEVKHVAVVGKPDVSPSQLVEQLVQEISQGLQSQDETWRALTTGATSEPTTSRTSTN